MRYGFLAFLLVVSSCGWPLRSAFLLEPRGQVVPIADFEDVRAVDGYASAAFQKSFDEAAQKHAERLAQHDGAEGKPEFNMLILSSGGVNGAFGAVILTAWSDRGDRPDFWIVTGVSVGAHMATYTVSTAPYLPSTTALAPTGAVNSGSMVPERRSSANSRMVSTGHTNKSGR